MSTYSLPRVMNGANGFSNKNIKYASLNRNAVLSPDINECVKKVKKNLLRSSSVAKNQFRGIRKDALERQNTLIAHSMTVGLLNPLKLINCLTNLQWDDHELCL